MVTFIVVIILQIAILKAVAAGVTNVLQTLIVSIDIVSVQYIIKRKRKRSDSVL